MAKFTCHSVERNPSEIREYERASTATLNAFLQPPVSDYLETLETSLEERDFRGRFLSSNLTVTMNLEKTKLLPVRTALSGPAAGVIAAAYRNSGRISFVISCDMGGTSFDVSLIVNGILLQHKVLLALV